MFYCYYRLFLCPVFEFTFAQNVSKNWVSAFFIEFLPEKKIEFSGEKLSFIAKFHSVFEKLLSFQNLRFFYGSVSYISAHRNATMGVLTLSVAKNCEKLSFSRISGSVSAKNWVLVQKLSFFPIQIPHDRAKKACFQAFLLPTILNTNES